MTDAPLLPPRPLDDWPGEIAHLREGFAGQLNIYRTMAHHPALLANWEDLRQHVVKENALGPERLEVVILRIATRLGSAYEWEHHVRRAEALGMDKARIASIGGSLDQMDPEDRLIASAVDALTEEARLTPGVVSELRELLGVAGILDMMATVGFYTTLGAIAETFRVSLDDLPD